jgi:predicted dehydrogenase
MSREVAVVSTLKMSVVGLGAVGLRMLEQVAKHPGFEVASAFDASPEACAHARALYPALNVCTDAAQAIAADGVDVVYVAVPPLHHAVLVRQAMGQGKAVFCEKPLGVDVADSLALTHEMDASGLGQAVNFVFASAPAVQLLQAALAAPDFGLRHVDLRLHFQHWPRPFQAHAAWLAQADQGGFTREVLSHFVYLLLRVLGPVQTVYAQCQRPLDGSAETQLLATLNAGGISVSVVATTAGAPTEVVRATFVGAQREYRLEDWYQLRQFDHQHPQGVTLCADADPRAATYQGQLDQLQALLRAQPHSLPSFGDALHVQTVIEGLLKA